VTMKTSSRQVDGVTVVDLSGSITLDQGSAMLRNTVKGLAHQGSSRIVLNVVLNMGGVTSMDSTGIGELISAYTSVRNAGGELKLLNLTREVHELLRITKLCTVFDIEDDETAAIAAFQH
jgi:anti-sigma B factor antagonist